jgi:hypothetical protein
MEPKSAQSEASMSAVSPLAIFNQPVHGSRNIATPTTISHPITEHEQQAVKPSGSDSSAAMPILVRQDNTHSSSTGKVQIDGIDKQYITIRVGCDVIGLRLG